MTEINKNDKIIEKQEHYKFNQRLIDIERRLRQKEIWRDEDIERIEKEFEEENKDLINEIKAVKEMLLCLAQ